MKNVIFILCLLTISSSCQKSVVKDEPSGVFVGKLFMKTNVVRSNGEIENLNLQSDTEIDFDNKIMKMGRCKNSVQIADNKGIIFGQAIHNFSHLEDGVCFVSSDTANYIINNDILNISFPDGKPSAHPSKYKEISPSNYIATEWDTIIVSRRMELKRK